MSRGRELLAHGGVRDKTLGECPFCASRIPYESKHCAYCGSGVSPGTP